LIEREEREEGGRREGRLGLSLRVMMMELTHARGAERRAEQRTRRAESRQQRRQQREKRRPMQKDH